MGGRMHTFRTAATGSLAVASLSLAACGSAETDTLETGDGQEARYTIATNSDDSSISIDGKDGAKIDIDAGEDVAVDLPEGFSLYPRARAVSSTRMQQSDGSGLLLVLESDASPEALVRFYREQAEGVGIVIDTEMKSAGSTMIQGQSTDGRIFSFNASTSGENSIGQLLVGRDGR